MGLTLLALLACTTAPSTPDPGDGGAAADGGTVQDPTTPQTPEAAELTPMQVLFRASLDLRGVRPSLEDLESVAKSPKSLDTQIETYLQDERFGEAFAWQMAGVWGTPVVNADHTEHPYPVGDVPNLLAAMGMEPLRLLGQIAVEDLPYPELFTADWTMVNESVLGFYLTDYPADGTGWKKVHYTDERPVAGVLATNGFWWRYTATQANANRGRANAVSRLFLCSDYLDMQIERDRTLNLLDAEAVANALQSSPACVACHYSLDPLAAYFWGFYRHFNFSPIEQASYHPERESWWEDYSGVAPGYFGTAPEGLSGLGRALAADPRTVECAVKRTMEQLLQRKTTLADTETLTQHREAFLAGNLTIRALVRSILESPAYRAEPAEGELLSPLKLVNSWQYAQQVEDLTGFRLASEGYDHFETDVSGVRSLAGGIGGDFTRGAPMEPIATQALVMQRVAEAAGQYVVAADHADRENPRLFGRLDPGAIPSEEEAKDQLVDLWLRVLGRRVDASSEEVDTALTLWTELFGASGDPALAWSGVVTWMLRHPDFILY